MRTLNSTEYAFVAGGTDADVDHAAGVVAAAGAAAAAMGAEPVAAALFVGAGLIELGGAIGDMF